MEKCRPHCLFCLHFVGFWGEEGREDLQAKEWHIGPEISKAAACINSINICQIDVSKGNGTVAKNSSEYNYSALGWEHFYARYG